MDSRSRIVGELSMAIFEIAGDLYSTCQTMCALELVDRLEEQGFILPGNRERVGGQVVSAALGIAGACDDGDLCEAVSSVFIDSRGWPLLVDRERRPTG